MEYCSTGKTYNKERKFVPFVKKKRKYKSVILNSYVQI